MRSHIRRLLESAGFSPRQLFAALQGAWLEPKQGFIWQENTGVTPTTTGGQTIGKIADLSGYGNVATQATAANRPTLQFNGALPLARFDTNDSLTLSLPAINVRRNLLGYTDAFTGSNWLNNGTTAKPSSYNAYVNSTLVALTEKATTGYHYAKAELTGANVAGQTYTASVYVKQNGRQYIIIAVFGASVAVYCAVNLSNGVVVSQINSTAKTELLGDGLYRISMTYTSAADHSGINFLLSNNGVNSQYTGDGTSGIYIWGAQLELGSVATDYQKITDWTSEAYSSNGSVYFSTPVGMSSLHNQSMATTYTLPALSSDIYSWIVVPERLSAAREAQLERYFLRLAGIAGPDYFEQVDYGPELVTNGTFATDLSRWTINGPSQGTATWVSGTARVARTGSAFGIFQDFSVDANKSYVIAGRVSGVTGTVSLSVWVGGGFAQQLSVSSLTTAGNFNFIVQSGANTSLRIYCSPGGASSGDFDNISVRELKDGMTGQLTADDGEQLLLAQ